MAKRAASPAAQTAKSARLNAAPADAARCDGPAAAGLGEELQRLRYLFDLTGYVVLRGVLSPAEVRAANAAVDARAADFKERTGALRNSKPGGAFAGDGVTGRLECGRMLTWPAPHNAVFRSALAHPRLVPLLNMLCGEGYRLDHLPLLIRQRKGAEGFDFHGGGVAVNGRWREELAYGVHAGADGPRPLATLLNVTFALTDVNPGDGGFVIIPGSHKSAFPLPGSVSSAPDMDICRTPELRAGDVLIFSEATTHGALPWAAEQERRTLFYRFSPAGAAYGRGYTTVFNDALRAELTPAQAAVLLPPHIPRLGRPSLAIGEDGEVVVRTPQPRAQERKDFDLAVFGHEYF